MSEETGPDSTSPDAADPAPTPPPSEPSPPREEARLQRQTFVMVNDRGRMVLLVGLCTLAGVAVGFGLATLVADHSCHHRPAVRAPVGLQVTPEMAPPLGFRSHGCDGRHGRHSFHFWDGDQGVHIWRDGWGGVSSLPSWAEDEDPAYLGIQVSRGHPGARVVAVVSGSPAEAAGVKVDDVVVDFDGEPVASPAQLIQLVRAAAPGDEVALRVRHDGKERRVEAALGSLSDAHR